MPYSQIKILGRHAAIILKLSKSGRRQMDENQENPYAFKVKDPNGKDKEIAIFSTYLHCFMVSAMIGELLGKKVDKDDVSDPLTKDESASIFPDQLQRETDRLDRIYKHIVLSQSKEDVDAKIQRAFSLEKSSYAEKEEVITSYARAGLEYLDKLFRDCKTYDDFCSDMVTLNDKISSWSSNPIA